MEVPFKLYSDLKKSYQSIQPESIILKSRIVSSLDQSSLLTSLEILDSIQLDVSDCRQNMHMNANGTATRMIKPGYYIHHKGNEIQVKLSEAEKEYQRTLANEEKIETALKNIFQPEQPSPL